MRATGGTIIGPIHVRKNTPNQDFYDYQISENFMIGAVADGAGSLKYSHIGSNTAVSETLLHLESLVKNSEDSLSEVLKQSFETARNALFNLPDSDQVGCTLTAAVITETDWAVRVVGDAFAIVSLENGERILVRPEKKSEYANITTLLTSNNMEIAELSGENPITSIFLSSDGLEYSGLEFNNIVEGFWGPIENSLKNDFWSIDDFFKFLDSKDKIIDDTTLVFLER